MSTSSVALLRLPPRVRFAICVMAGAYPLITTLLSVSAPLIGHWPLALRTLVIVPLMVSGMVFGIIPLVQRWAGEWIAAGATRAESA